MWSSSIDQPMKSNRVNELLFNFTSPWFGSYCQYSFEIDSNYSETTFSVQPKVHIVDAITHFTCYVLIKCDHGAEPMCLDWREVCDGRIDCLNDGVDEIFLCGDGECVEDFGECQNGRHLLLIESLSVQGNLSDNCWITMVCLSKIVDHVNGVSCKQFLNLSQILSKLENCTYPIQFPIIPVLLGHVRCFYAPNQTFNINVELALVPDYVCYDEELCDFLTPIFR
ncbi:unnamed protein product, partial [Rotaria socialis]